MPKLILNKITCHKTNDSHENDQIFDVGQEDEPYILVNGKEIWSERMIAGSVKDLARIKPIPFNNTLKLVLKERDPGYLSGTDDLLGELTIFSADTGTKKHTHVFKKGKAKYTLTYLIKN